MNKNRQYITTAHKSIALAMAGSLMVGGSSQAAELTQYADNAGSTDNTVVESASSGVYAGVFETTAQIHDTLSVKELKADKVAEDTVDVSTLLMANVKSALNIRSAASKSSAVVGQLRPTDVATILSTADDWYEIESGQVHGYVASKFCLVGEEAKARMDAYDNEHVVCKVKTLNVRSAASMSAPILTTVSYGQSAPIISESEDSVGWVPVKIGETTGYVAANYVSVVKGGTTVAVSIIEDIKGTSPSEVTSFADNNEEAAAPVASAETVSESTEIAPEVAPSNTSVTVNYPVAHPAVTVSVEDHVLLAALLQCEAGGSYEGMLAVGGVVMNRVRAGYAADVRGVIFQRGQFSPAGSGKVNRVIASNSVKPLALQAAAEALAGVDITNGCRSFRAAWTGHAGTNIGGNVFF